MRKMRREMRAPRVWRGLREWAAAYNSRRGIVEGALGARVDTIIGLFGLRVYFEYQSLALWYAFRHWMGSSCQRLSQHHIKTHIESAFHSANTYPRRHLTTWLQASLRSCRHSSVRCNSKMSHSRVISSRQCEM